MSDQLTAIVAMLCVTAIVAIVYGRTVRFSWRRGRKVSGRIDRR
jgi:hypothetical protein